jgi:hypothetical protein
MTAEALLSRLDKCREVGAGRWLSRCPSHQDKTPSLSIKQLENGKVLIHCFAGCGAIDVLDSLNLNWGDLFPDEWTPIRPPRWAALDAAVVIVARDNIHRGLKLSDKDMKRYREASRRLYGD